MLQPAGQISAQQTAAPDLYQQLALSDQVSAQHPHDPCLEASVCDETPVLPSEARFATKHFWSQTALLPLAALSSFGVAASSALCRLSTRR